MSWYQSCRFLRLGHHSSLHHHFFGLHSWIFFYSCVLLPAFIAIDFFVSRSALILRDQVFSWKMLENSGTPSFSFCINASHRVYDDSWIIDSDATNHMTSKSQLFNTYTPSPSNKKIVMANGSLVTVAGFGDIYITPTLILKNVLHVPKLSANLVSIQKLTHDLKCYAIFFPSYCVL